MRASRFLGLVVSLLLGASSLAVLALGAPAQAAEAEILPCGSGVPRPCVLSATRNGAALPGNLEVRGVWDDDGTTKRVSFSVQKKNPPDVYDLGAPARSDTFSVTLDMGSWKPSIAAGKGRDAQVVRTRVPGGGYRLTITARPVLLAGQCDQSQWPWRCPEADVVVNDPEDFNNVQWDAIWSMEVSDAGFIADPKVEASLYGLDYFHNFAASALPPRVDFSGPDDTANLVVEVANRRYLDDLVTLVRGHAEMRIPNSFLRVGYGIPDPSTMTGSGLAVSGSGSGATVSITQESGEDAMRVLIDGMTFPDIGVPDGELRPSARSSTRSSARSSARVLKVKRGVITPTRVKVASTDRLAPAKGVVKARKAKARGARITGYQARCTAGPRTLTGKAKGRRVVITGLKRNVAYTCKVRALSKAGPATYGKAKRLAARP